MKEGALKEVDLGQRVGGRLWERRATGEGKQEQVQSFAKGVLGAESPGPAAW